MSKEPKYTRAMRTRIDVTPIPGGARLMFIDLADDTIDMSIELTRASADYVATQLLNAARMIPQEQPND